MSRKRGKGGQRDYEVGYGKPPVQSQFQPGRSGNPRGRPKKSQNRESILNRVFSRRISLIVEGERTKVPVAEAVMQRLLSKALAGDHRAMDLFLKYALAKEATLEEEVEVSEAVTTDDEAVIARYLGRRQRDGWSPAGGADEQGGEDE